MSKQSRFRTLVRIEKVGEGFVLVCVPGWNPHVSIRLDRWDIPNDIWPVLAAGKRVHAKVNLAAETRSQLNFSNWEKE
jgi:hypothetical protein